MTEMQSVPTRSVKSLDRRLSVLLFVTTLAIYSYFFAGLGYNQDAHFNAMRSLIHTGHFAIPDRFQETAPTADVSFANGLIYSNKPPGLAMFCVPLYIIVAGAEQTMGYDSNSQSTVIFNLYLMTIWGSGPPTAALV